MKLSQLAEDALPYRMTQEILDNVAYHQMRPEMVMRFVDQHMRQIEDRFPEGLEYHNLTMVEPAEEVRLSVIKSPKSSSQRLKYDKNNTYMVKFNLSFNGERLGPVVTRLPYITRAGEFTLDGKRSFVLPVVVDRGVNLKVDSCYIYLARANYTYTRQHYDFHRNGWVTRENVLTARLHQMNKKKHNSLVTSGPDRITSEPSIFLYLLAKKGVTAAAKDYFGLDVKVVEGEDEQIRQDYPAETHTVFSSIGFRPGGVKKDFWAPPSLSLVFEGDASKTAQIFAANFFYLYDLFTSRTDLSLVDDPEHWEMMAGIIIFNYPEKPHDLQARFIDHVTRSIETLLDTNTRFELALDGIEVSNIYDLLAWLIQNEPNYFNRELSTMYNKRVQTARYTLAAITSAITNLSYDLDLLKEHQLNQKKLTKLFQRRIKEGLIRGVKSRNGEVQSLQVPTDNIFLNISRRIVHQGQTVKGGGGGGKAMYRPENFAHASMLVYTNPTGLPKIRPNGREYFNPAVKLDKSYGLYHDPVYNKTMDVTQQDLRRQ